MNKNGKAQGGLVYSTDGGRMCPACRRPLAECACAKAKPALSSDGIVRVSRESRVGKSVTVIRGLALESAALNELGKRLKAACGAGGTVKDGVVEIQGDHRDKVILILRTQGWAVTRAGG
jgi:translation initiation factor 1